MLFRSYVQHTIIIVRRHILEGILKFNVKFMETSMEKLLEVLYVL